MKIGREMDMKLGDSVLCPVYSITHRINPIVANRENLFEIISIDGKNYLKTNITRGSLTCL